MKKNRTILIAVLIIALAFGAGLLWRWVQGTPYYALYQIGAGLKNRDLNTFLTYVDVESILNQQASESISALLSSLTASGSVGKIAGPLGEIKIKISPEFNKGLSNLAIRQLQDYLENPKNPTLPSSFLLLTAAQFNSKTRLYPGDFEKGQGSVADGDAKAGGHLAGEGTQSGGHPKTHQDLSSPVSEIKPVSPSPSSSSANTASLPNQIVFIKCVSAITIRRTWAWYSLRQYKHFCRVIYYRSVE